MKLLQFSGYFILFLLSACSAAQTETDTDGTANQKAELERYYKRLLADPKTGLIPQGIRAKELAFTQTLPVYKSIKRGEDIWKSRGPLNQGGRTRAFGINVNNKNELLAGAATGGIYKSTDAGKSWTKTICPANAITCLVQDTRPGKTGIWYAGTGELYGSSGSGGGAYYSGVGILKSTDGGNSWSILPFTAGSSSTAFDSDFDGIWNIAIDYSNTVEDEIYAATYGGIYKSTDGGVNWKKKRSGALPNYSYCTDVAIDINGVVYATMSSESTHRGIWRSTDGETWISILPSGFSPKYGRMCIGIAPSDPNQVYIVATGTTDSGHRSVNFQGVVEWNSLWKYNYVSGNGSGSGGRWVNRSKNMPDKGGDFGYYSTQGGYDLFIRVMPDDTNTVFIGATNLWRSKDAFRTTTKTDWIGGYAVNTYRPDFQLYKNHHPDNHHLVFMSENPLKAFSTHDGGISYTDNIMAESVVWEDRSSNYITSQFYTVAIDHSLSGDNKIIGGLQDNGTMFMNVYGAGSWQMSFNGDGSYCSFREGSKEVFVSAQQGRVARIEIDDIGKPVKYARLDPSKLSRNDYDFINPFVVDPVNQNIMYLPSKTRLFRNLSINDKALSTTFDSVRWNTPLWEEMTACVPPTGHEFSAIAMSKSNPNTLYYGSNYGKLFRVRQANTGNPVPEDISGPAFGTGNINCIALDPLDSLRITVVFSNYNIISLYSSSDGGLNWTNISGNLEENPNGTGSGPSCRWANVLTLANGNKCWFVGTSTGLFATDTLNGNQTRWIRQSPAGIGNNIVTMIDVRQQDYYVVAATHGNGVYSANIAAPWQITSAESVVKEALKFEVWPNPVSDKFVFLTVNQELSSLSVYKLMDMNGRSYLLHADASYTNAKDVVKLLLPDLPPGIYILELSSGTDKSYKKIYIRN